jgi:hypothetical protein
MMPPAPVVSRKMTEAARTGATQEHPGMRANRVRISREILESGS